MAKWPQQEIERLAQSLADTIKGVKPAGIRLRTIEAPRPTLFDSITRDACLKRIQFLARRYQLAWLVDQELFDTPGLHSASDERLSALLRDLEHARECLHEGIAMEDAGLVRNTSGRLPQPSGYDHGT